ncbi:MAG: hypothetical protein PUG97_05495 [bacterium]|nr:hypothetical protein [bacterium]MDD7329194.1 hypothetical protein [bacterium]MDY5256633.1 hypothetical protein [Candidatus Enterosoma sp.]
MKKNLLAVLLPVVAGVALSGTGFGLWVFNTTVDSKKAGAGLYLEPAIQFNTNALTVTDVIVTNKNDASIPDKMIFDQDYIGLTEKAWQIDITVKVSFEVLKGTTRADEVSSVYDGTYATAGEVAFATTTKGELKDRLDHYSVTVSWDQNLAHYIELDTGISGGQTQQLSEFSSFLEATTTMESLAETPEITHTYHFSFHPSDNYNNINDKVSYEALRTAISSGTMNFTASFATTTA